ncbi:M3 family oligoendopeptidase [Miltoncostaea marina]|uniref:M3 family oligoendopeptidase n=1 Tax=Miltoncostaea marina TaxID=2843215 RepID=UPI001C3E25CC|nr:M3 family oligoendopeptidase [Miltoncostaea marina]
MTTATDTTPSGPRAAGVHWDLSPLVADAAQARERLAAALERSRAFEARYRGALATIDGPGLAEALAELAAIDNELSRVGSYANLRESVDVTSEENKDLAAAVDRGMVEASNALRFFDLEWLALDEDRARELHDAPEVAADRHYLIALRRFAPHTLSEPEERMLAERSPAAVSAWQTLFGQITSTLEVPFDAGDGEGEQPHTIDRLLALVRHPGRDVRRRALETLYEGLAPHADTLSHCYDTLVGDRLAMDKLRGYGGPMEPTHLRNELPGPVVEAMLDAVERHYGIAHRWFRVKAGLLGLERLELHDQYAPIGEARAVAYPEAQRLIRESFGRFSPRVEDVARGFFAESRIDAEPRAGKRGGAFCAPVAQDASPYVLMNFTDKMDDVMTLAHELGHGMHFTFSSAAQTALSMGTGLALAEVPSTFAELLTFDHLMETESDPSTRRSLLSERVEGSFATVFRQTVLARYEQRAYALRAEGGTLTADRLSDIWFAENEKYYGDTLLLPQGYRLGWSYIPHFISTRFYTYAYVFAHLATLALYARYREIGAGFVDAYIAFLSAGGSATPDELLGGLGVDLSDPGVWEPGFREMERMVEAAEAG